MKQSRILLFCLLSCLLTSCTDNSNLSGNWNFAISNYKNTCGGEPTVSKTIHLVQNNKQLTATIKVQGDDGKKYTGTFQGKLAQLSFPMKTTLHGKFKVANFTTKETIIGKFIDNKTFSGKSKWISTSSDKKMICKGSQTINGNKQ